MSWHVKVPVEGSRHLDIVDDEGRTIAHVHRRTGMEPGEYTRNAHLLAEAPDLKDFEQTMIARRGEIERTAEDLEWCRAALGGLIEALEFEMQDNHHPLNPRAVVCLAMVEAREALK